MIEDARPKTHGHLPLSNPLSFLYSHAAELALKAFLQAKNIPTPEKHALAKLYAKCCNCGLVIGPEDRFEIGNIVSVLDFENEDQGFRYFNLKSGSTADLSRVREVILELIRAVEPHVPDIPAPAKRPKFPLVFPKPTPKTGVNPLVLALERV
jgi:hypothetical protein